MNVWRLVAHHAELEAAIRWTRRFQCGPETKTMTWKEIRTQYPNQWLLIEANQAHSEANQRLLDQIAVVDKFNNSIDAQHPYRKLHHDSPSREMYVIHTSREEPAIEDRRWLGVRL